MPGKMQYLRYTSDDTVVYAIKTRDFYRTAKDTAAGAAALGFTAAEIGDPLLPKGMRPRGVYLQDPTGGSTRFVPCGTVTCPAWAGTVATVQGDYSGVATLTEFIIGDRRPEKPRKHVKIIVNRTDAA